VGAFEGGLLPVRVQLQKHQIPNFERNIPTFFICNLLHAINESLQIAFELTQQLVANL
jgi:hypothetical protein